MTPIPRLTIGEERPGRAWTLLTFMDGSTLLVHWDGDHQVSGLASSDPVIVYYPGGRRTHIPWHRIERVDHQEREDSIQ